MRPLRLIVRAEVARAAVVSAGAGFAARAAAPRIHHHCRRSGIASSVPVAVPLVETAVIAAVAVLPLIHVWVHDDSGKKKDLFSFRIAKDFKNHFRDSFNVMFSLERRHVWKNFVEYI